MNQMIMLLAKVEAVIRSSRIFRSPPKIEDVIRIRNALKISYKFASKVCKSTYPETCQFFDDMKEPMSAVLFSFMQAIDWIRKIQAFQKLLLIVGQFFEYVGLKAVLRRIFEQREIVIFTRSVSTILAVFVNPKYLIKLPRMVERTWRKQSISASRNLDTLYLCI